MAINSCISEPAQEPLLMLKQWHLEFCDNNHCAAALLSFFIYWHDIKLRTCEKNRQLNRAALSQGKKARHDESLWQYYTQDSMQAGIMGLYSKKTIRIAIKCLAEKGVIKVTSNPN